MAGASDCGGATLRQAPAHSSSSSSSTSSRAHELLVKAESRGSRPAYKMDKHAQSAELQPSALHAEALQVLHSMEVEHLQAECDKLRKEIVTLRGEPASGAQQPMVT